MRKVLWLLPALFFYALTVNAQKSSHELKLGYGVITAPQDSKNIGKAGLHTINSVAGYSSLSLSGKGAFAFSYLYKIKKGKASFGVDFIYDKTTASFAYKTAPSKQFDITWYTVLGRADVSYWSNKIVAVYGGLSAGVSSSRAKGTVNASDTKNYGIFAYQLTPVGIRAGHKVAFFAELGYGFRGVLQFGISYKP